MTYPYGLRTFGHQSFQQLFPPEESRVDAVNVSLGLGHIAGTDEDIRRFVSSVPRCLTLPDGEELPLFNNPRQPQNSGKFEWSVARPRGRGASRPLFAGRLGLVRSVSSGAGASPGQYRWNLYCTLQINPTRWMRHQPFPEQTAPPDSRPETARLFESLLEESADGEVLLYEEADNVVMGSATRIAMAHRQHRDVQYTRYITAICDLLSVQVISRASRRSGLNYVGPIEIKITHLEVYWELATPSPVEALQEMEARARNLAARSHTTFRGIRRRAASLQVLSEDIALGRHNNSPCYTFMMRRGVAAKIYAKTNRRIRFEVRFDCRQTRPLTGPLVCSNVEEVISFFNRASNQAVPILREVFEFLFTYPSEEGTGEVDGAFDSATRRKEPHELIIDVMNIVPERDVANHIVSALVLHGFVTNPGDQHFRNAIRRLKAQNVLKPAIRQGRTYLHFVHDRYAPGLDALREARQNLHLRNHVTHTRPTQTPARRVVVDAAAPMPSV